MSRAIVLTCKIDLPHALIDRLPIHLLRLVGRLRIRPETRERVGCYPVGERSQEVLLHFGGRARKHPAVHRTVRPKPAEQPWLIHVQARFGLI